MKNVVLGNKDPVRTAQETIVLRYIAQLDSHMKDVSSSRR
jgi:hypothetical protein